MKLDNQLEMKVEITDEKPPNILNNGDITILPPKDVFETLDGIDFQVTTTMLDPWYNKGIGGVIENYKEWIAQLLKSAARVSDHIYLWGFPEIIYKAMDNIPEGFQFIAWLTWYFKNCPSKVKGWRSAQYTCLHFARPTAKLYPEHFLNEAQLDLKKRGKLMYMPGPANVIEESLLVGFVGKNEHVGHPAQKPIKVYEPLIKMTTKEGDIVLDPMCGSGTTGVVCNNLGRKAILCDYEEEYIEMTEKRLNIKRVAVTQCSPK